MSLFGLVPQNYYWAWSLAAFVTIAAIIAACSLPVVVNASSRRVAMAAPSAARRRRRGRAVRRRLAALPGRFGGRRRGRGASASAGRCAPSWPRRSTPVSFRDHVEVDLSRAFFANDYPYVMLAELQRAGIEFRFAPESRNLDRFGESRCVEAGRYQRLLLIAGADPELAPGSVIVAEVVGITRHGARRVRALCSSASVTCCATAPSTSTAGGMPTWPPARSTNWRPC